jgi:2,5-diamino-6-(ribosylamino)-4(3H)-pyrimidinone 5'-phosphate reductase
MFVFSNLATSLDGKIATASREPSFLGTPADRRQMQVLRKRCDILLMGAGTLRSYRKFCAVQGAPAKRQPANAIVSVALEGVSPQWSFFSDPGLRRLLLITSPEKLSLARRRAFEKTSEIIELSKDTPRNPVAIQIIKALKSRGFEKLLVEGGGEVMWQFSSQNLIDEYNVTLTPKIVGGKHSPTLVEGVGFSPERILSLKLHRCRRLGDELYLVYRKR